MRFKLHHSTPIRYVIGLLVNLVLILALEVLLIYRYPAQMEPADFARIDSVYENCSVIADSGRLGTNCYLVQQENGQQDLIPVKSHPFFYNRIRVYDGKIQERVQLDDSFALLLGTQQTTFEIMEDYVVVSSMGGGLQATLTYYMVISCVLGFLELALWDKLRGN